MREWSEVGRVRRVDRKEWDLRARNENVGKMPNGSCNVQKRAVGGSPYF